jgi:hypothetical protein
VGTASNPITFTSINDNSVGGTTGNGSPQAGSWDGIYVGTSGSIDLEHAGVTYASTSVSVFSSNTQLLSQVTIGDSGVGIADILGNVSFRGTLLHDTTDITSCDWGTDGCSVDAAFVNWGSDNGPPLGESPPSVCGAVTVAPWETSAGTPSDPSDSSIYSVPNCDGSQTPDQQLVTAQAAYGQRLSELQAECDADPQDCGLFQESQACFTAAFDLASSTADFPYSSPDDAVSGASTFIHDGEAVVASIASAVPFAGEIVGAAKDIYEVALAYSSC